jgi:catechol 2,3-dioxygenase-like lactoylglutathione lyase family enzyme
MRQRIAHVSLLVRDDDEAISFFTRALGFELVEDKPSTDRRGRDKRWVLVAPPNSAGSNLLLAKASNEEEATRIGNQTGGRVFLFLHTDDFWRDYRALIANGVRFVREPKDEPYGTLAVFEDLYGNRWDLLQPV